jgi:flagellin
MEITMAITFTTKPGFILGASASNTNRNFYDNTLEKLSSGRRINSAADDAAGLAVLSKLEAALSGKEQAIRNAADGQGLLHTAEAGAAEVSNILHRMRELAVQAANGTQSIAGREALQSEADQLTAEINRIANNTSFNGQTPLSGANVDLQVGASVEERINVNIEGVRSSDLQLDTGQISFDTSANARESMVTIDQAIEKVNSVRSDIGATVNRLSTSIDHLSHAAKNTKIAAGRASDADIENEAARRAKSQILTQSSIAISAQGNASKGMILHLIS